MKLIRRLAAILFTLISRTLLLLWAAVSNTAVFLFFILAAMGGSNFSSNRSTGSGSDAYDAQANTLRQAELDYAINQWDDR